MTAPPIDPPTEPALSAQLVALYALRPFLDPPTATLPATTAARALWEAQHCLCGHPLARHTRRRMVGPGLVRGCDDCAAECPMAREWTEQDRFVRQVNRELTLLPTFIPKAAQ